MYVTNSLLCTLSQTSMFFISVHIQALPFPSPSFFSHPLLLFSHPFPSPSPFSFPSTFSSVSSLSHFETGSCYIALASPELAIPLPQSPRSWDFSMCHTCLDTLFYVLIKHSSLFTFYDEFNLLYNRLSDILIY